MVVAAALALGASTLARAIFADASLGTLLQVGAGALAFGTLNGAQVGVLNGLERFRAVCAVNIARGVAVSVFMTVGGLVMGVTGAVAGLSIGELVGAAAGAIAVQRACRVDGVDLDLRLAWRERATLWRFSLPVLCASLAVQPAMWVGQIVLVRRTDGAVQTGYFAYGYRWYLFIMFFASAMAPIGLPMLTNLRATARGSTHARFLRIAVAVNLVVVILPGLAVVLLAHRLTSLAGTGYAPAAPTIVVLALTCIPSTINTVLSQAALSLDRVRAWVVSDVVLAGSLVVSAVALVPRLGSVGLADAYLIGMTATCAVLMGPVRSAVRNDGRGAHHGDA
jgi:O-antigen/teichoic acid export membrane protein